MNRSTPHRYGLYSKLPAQGVLPVGTYNKEKLTEWYKACGALRGDAPLPPLNQYLFINPRTDMNYATGYVAWFKTTAVRARTLSQALQLLNGLEESYHQRFAILQARLQKLTLDPATSEATYQALQEAIDGTENEWAPLLRYQREQSPTGLLAGCRGDRERAAQRRAGRVAQ